MKRLLLKLSVLRELQKKLLETKIKKINRKVHKSMAKNLSLKREKSIRKSSGVIEAIVGRY